MNGPEHYAEAERLVARAEQGIRAATANTYADVAADAALLVAEAQVHATLAMAASNACSTQLPDEEPIVAVHSDPGWEQVLGYETLRRDGGYAR